jgi:catechol 2,3-dioxygenase-like lactoylglutathione lyase family enzyme
MRLNQVTLPSIDLEVSIPFYEQLGLQLIVKALPHYARFVFPEDKSTFSLHQVTKLPTGEGVSIYFECDDLDERVTKLIAAGIAFDEEPNDKPWRWREARLKDPDGNQLIFYYGGKDRLNPPWQI